MWEMLKEDFELDRITKALTKKQIADFKRFYSSHRWYGKAVNQMTGAYLFNVMFRIYNSLAETRKLKPIKYAEPFYDSTGGQSWRGFAVLLLWALETHHKETLKRRYGEYKSICDQILTPPQFGKPWKWSWSVRELQKIKTNTIGSHPLDGFDGFSFDDVDTSIF